jgi:hypothetical protein
MESFMADAFKIESFLNLYEIISDWSVLEGVNDLESWPLATSMERNSQQPYRRCNKQHGCGKERVLKR